MHLQHEVKPTIDRSVFLRPHCAGKTACPRGHAAGACNTWDGGDGGGDAGDGGGGRAVGHGQRAGTCACNGRCTGEVRDAFSCLCFFVFSIFTVLNNSSYTWLYYFFLVYFCIFLVCFPRFVSIFSLIFLCFLTPTPPARPPCMHACFHRVLASPLVAVGLRSSLRRLRHHRPRRGWWGKTKASCTPYWKISESGGSALPSSTIPSTVSPI